MYYYWFEWTRAFFESAAAKSGRASKRLSTIESMMAGALAGSATVIITNPIWVLNTRMTTRKQEKKGDVEAGVAKAPAKAPGTIGTLLSMLKTEGPQAFFAGVVPALVLVINPILQYTLFEQLKNSVERRRKVTPTIAFFLGALGKLFATGITYPYITVKSRMHVAGNGDKEGMMDAIRRVIKEEGYAGLYKGLSPRRETYGLRVCGWLTMGCTGIGPKITQSVITAAFLFAFKDVLYAQMVRLRMGRAKAALKA